jgi:hypothetical protein
MRLFGTLSLRAASRPAAAASVRRHRRAFARPAAGRRRGAGESRWLM